MVGTVGVLCVYPWFLGVVGVFVDGTVLGRGVHVVIKVLDLLRFNCWFFDDLGRRSVLSLGEFGHVYLE